MPLNWLIFLSSTSDRMKTISWVNPVPTKFLISTSRQASSWNSPIFHSRNCLEGSLSNLFPYTKP